jgi:hypothetical protein
MEVQLQSVRMAILPLLAAGAMMMRLALHGCFETTGRKENRL